MEAHDKITRTRSVGAPSVGAPPSIRMEVCRGVAVQWGPPQPRPAGETERERESKSVWLFCLELVCVCSCV